MNPTPPLPTVQRRPSALQIAWRAAWAAAMIALALGGLPGHAAEETEVPPTPDQAYALALEAQTDKDYAGMLQWLRTSAAAGFVPAQELLGIALLGGPALFGNAVRREPCEAHAWFVRAADEGSEIGRMHRDLMNRQLRGRRCEGEGGAC